MITPAKFFSTAPLSAIAPMTALTVAPELEITIGALKPVMHRKKIVDTPAATKPAGTLVPQIVAIKIVAVRTANTNYSVYPMPSLRFLGFSLIPYFYINNYLV